MTKPVRGIAKKVFVTGATGFVGRRLCHSLVEMGYSVRGGVRSVGKRSLLPSETEICIMDDIGPHADWTEALESVATVIHLASRVHVMQETSPDSLNEFRRVNTSGTEGLANMAAKAGVRRIIFLSTVKVNGEKIQDHAFTEEDPVSPEDPYAQSKWEAEQILVKIAGKTGIEVVIIRPPLVYGPGVGGNFIRLLDWVSKGIPLPLSLVHNKRSLIYLGNLIDAIVTCIDHQDAAGETFLVSDGEDISTPQLIRMIASAMGKRSRLIPFPSWLLKSIGGFTGKEQEIERLTGSLLIDSSKIRKVLGWKPPFTMEEGIYETVRWYKSYKEV